jgi:hypothetical protein
VIDLVFCNWIVLSRGIVRPYGIKTFVFLPINFFNLGWQVLATSASM